MKTFNQFITELFNTVYHVTKVRALPHRVDYKFTTKNNDTGIIVFNHVKEDTTRYSEQPYWYLYFMINGDLGKTGGGDAFSILSTVLSAIKSFIVEYTPNAIVFTASKDAEDDEDGEAPVDRNPESRKRLYSTMLSKFARAQNYKFSEVENSRETVYILKLN